MKRIEMKKLRNLTILLLTFLSIDTFSKIKIVDNHTAINRTATNIDIDQNGLWDAKIYKDAWDNYKIQVAYQDASNFTAINVISTTQPTPVPFPYEADMNAVGKWIHIADQSALYIEDFSQQGTKYIGIVLVKNDIPFCAWIEIYNGSGSLLELGSYAWEDDKNKCLWAGQTESGSIQMDQNMYVSVSPNPATDLIYIQGNLSAVDVDIYSALGVKVLSIYQVYSNIPLDISNLPIGIYYIFIKENNARIRKKIVVSR